MNKHTITLHGINILVFVKGENHFADLNHICKELGMDFSDQLKSIKNEKILNDRLTLLEIPQLNEKPKRIYTLPMEQVFGYIFRLEFSEVSEAFKPKLKNYKEEGYQAIYDFMKGSSTDFNFNINTLLS